MKSEDLPEFIGIILRLAYNTFSEYFDRLGRAYLIVSALALHIGVIGYAEYVRRTCTEWCLDSAIVDIHVQAGFILLVSLSVLLVVVDALLRKYYTRNEGDSE